METGSRHGAHKYPQADGWEVVVKYKSDPENVYRYFFTRQSFYGIQAAGGKMTLSICDANGNDAQYHCLYPPLWDDVRSH